MSEEFDSELAVDEKHAYLFHLTAKSRKYRIRRAARDASLMIWAYCRDNAGSLDSRKHILVLESSLESYLDRLTTRTEEAEHQIEIYCQRAQAAEDCVRPFKKRLALLKRALGKVKRQYWGANNVEPYSACARRALLEDEAQQRKDKDERESTGNEKAERS